MLQSDFMAHLARKGASQGAFAALLALMPAVVAAADMSSPAKVEQGAVLATPLAGQPLDGLRASRERPLFSPTRRPPPPPPSVTERSPEPPAPLPPPNVSLFGIVMDDGEARAIVRTAPAADVLHVRTGDDIGGWKVAQIEGRRLVLSLDGRLATFTMFAGNVSAAAPPAGPPPSQDVELTFRYPTSQNQLPQNPLPPAGASPPRHPQNMHR
jgi:hypothetical protein